MREWIGCTGGWSSSLVAAALVAAGLTTVGCGDETDPGGETPPHTGDLTMGRLVVADHESGTAWVFDLDEDDAATGGPTLLSTLSVEGPARVYAGLHGRYAYLVQRESNRVDVLDSGLVFESHVDHYHIDRRAPAMMDLRFEGMAPTHFVHHDGWVAIFYDGTGNVDVMQERSLSAGAPEVRTIATGPAHHGVALAARGHVFATIGAEGASLPDTVGIWPVTGLDGAPEATAAPCPGLHGGAAAGDRILFGCSDGVLAIEAHGDHFDTVKIDAPAGTAEGTRVGRLAAHAEQPVFVGNWGQEGFALVDPSAGTITPVATEAPAVSFAFSMHGDALLALTADGRLHRLEPGDGAARGEPLAVTGPIELGGGHGAARPSIAIGAGRVYVAVPGAGEVIEVHVEDWAVERTWTVPGVPHSITAVSVSPDWSEDHEHGEHEHEDEHEDEHDHHDHD